MSPRAIRYRQRRKQRRYRRVLRVILGATFLLGSIYLLLHMFNSRSTPAGSSSPVDSPSVQF